jgi:Ca-activated chloride channel homolog
MPTRRATALLTIAAPSLAALLLAACSAKDMSPEPLVNEGVTVTAASGPAPIEEGERQNADPVAQATPMGGAPAVVVAETLEMEESAGADLGDLAALGYLDAGGTGDTTALGAGAVTGTAGLTRGGAVRPDAAAGRATREPRTELATTEARGPRKAAKRKEAKPRTTAADKTSERMVFADAAAPPAPPADLMPRSEPMPEGELMPSRDADAEDDDRSGAIATHSPGQPIDALAAATQGAEDYKDYGVNPFTLSSDDALSTFSIDVDTAAYSMARRKLDGGALPPEAAVRVEEFVNYLDYDSYITPKNDPFAVNMEAMPDPFRPGHHLLRVGVQGKEVSRDERKPVHLVFLVDVSGSMSSADKLGYAKKSLHMMVDGLREDDTVGLCTYAGRTARVLEPTSAGNKREIHGAIEGLKSGGSTAMSSGIDIAYEMAMQQFKPGHENRVVVLSDGDANVGRTSWDDMLGQIKGYADKGVTLSTIGFGTGNYQDTLMEQLANNGDGNNFYIDSQEQAQRVFVEELGGTMITIARDVKIQVEFNPESVAAYRLIGYENRDIADKDFRNDRVDAGEVGSGHNVTALYDVILRDGYTAELATVRMRYEAPGADKAASEKLWIFPDKRLKETPFQATRDTRMAYSAATFAEILRGSPHAAEIDLEALARFASKSSRPGEKDDAEMVKLMRKAKALGAGGAALVRR